MKRAALLLLGMSLSAAAHVVSMSTGEATLDGTRLEYELRMPLYEVAHMQNPEKQLFEHLQFAGAGQIARLTEHACRSDSVNLVCTGVYRFERAPGQLEVECTFASITVPNHVHLLRATQGDNAEQAAFDASFPSTTIRFHPPTAWEIAARDTLSGVWRAASGPAQVLFLAALVLAARTRRELFALTAWFLAGEAIIAVPHLWLRLQLSPRFVEAATALTIAYLAVEILILPTAGQRWLIAGVLGLLHGMYFDMLLAAGDYRLTPFLLGAFVSEIAIVIVLALLARVAARIPAMRSLPVARAFASLLLITGLSWFLLRLKN